MTTNSNYFSSSNFKSTTLIDILRWQAVHQPDQCIYTYLVDGEKEELSLTYKELDTQARSIAAKLQSSGKIGDRALLLYPPGLEFIAAYFGCFYSGIIAVPVYPPHPSRPEQTLPKLLTIINDAEPSLMLTTSSILNIGKTLFARARFTKKVRWIATNTVPKDMAEKWQEHEIGDDNLAFLQYTSGSTTTPRGVMVSHGNLMYNLSLIQKYFEHTQNSQGVIWLPPYHDMGLIGGILQPLYCGFPVTLMSPVVFLQRPFRWLQAISRFKGTTSGGPNFAFDLCVRRITPDQRASLDLSTWDIAFNGAEPINCETLERFTEYFEPCGFRHEAFYPCYGLAEATLIASGGLKAARPIVQELKSSVIEQNKVTIDDANNESTRKLVSCGQSMAGQKIVIVNPQSLTLCRSDEIGEIWISGPSIAQGYWNRQSETEQTFKAYTKETKEGPFLRSGDLGFIKDGELFVTGRLKDLIIIDGRNHYPQDIERTVEYSHKSLRAGCCAAFSINIVNEEQLIVVAEVDPRYTSRRSQKNKDITPTRCLKQHMPLNVKEIVTSIRKSVSEHHDLRIYDIIFLKPGSIPKTSSGKIRRYVCKTQYHAGTLNMLRE